MPVTINGTTGITTPAIVNGSALAFRNKIINGNFDIWQRGTSLISGTTSRYLADRFTNGASGTACTPSQVAFALGQPDVPNEPDYYISTIVASAVGANNNATLHQHIESVKSCAGKTVTLSFYAKSNASRNIAVELYQNFGTGGTPSPNVSIPAGLVALTTSWQKFTVTVNIPSISGKVLGTAGNDSLVAYFWFDAGSNPVVNARASSLGQQSGTFDIAQVQLEEGSVATPFEQRPIGTELALCQRYFEKNYPQNVAPGTVTNGFSTNLGYTDSGAYNTAAKVLLSVSTNFIVPKRSSPVVTTYSGFSSTPNRCMMAQTQGGTTTHYLVNLTGSVGSNEVGLLFSLYPQGESKVTPALPNGNEYLWSFFYTAEAEL